MRARSLLVLFAVETLACAAAPPPDTTAPPKASATTTDGAHEAEVATPGSSAQSDAESAPSDASPPDASPSDASPSDAPMAPASGDATSEQDWLRVGAPTDGATLTTADVKAGPASGATLVLSFDGAGPPPATRARVENPGLVVVVVEGVRQVKAQLPVVTGEGFRVIGKPRKVDRGPVRSIGRGFYGDDSGIRIDVELSAPSTIELAPSSGSRGVELRVSPTK